MIFISVLTLVLLVLSVSPFVRLESASSGWRTPARAEPDPEPYVCPVDGKPVTNADQSLLGVPLNQYAAPLGGEGNFNDATRTVVEKLAEANVHYVRRGLHWHVLEPQPLPTYCHISDRYCWEIYDQMITDLKNLGFEPVITLGGVPEWASTAPDVDNDGNGRRDDYAAYPPVDIEDWENFVRAVVKRYGHGPNGRRQVRNWEIWNEPDIDQFFKGTADDYLELLNTSYDVIKEVDLEAKVWGPTTIYFLDRLDDWMAPREKYPFTQMVIENGQIDVFSVHVYANIEESYNQIKELRGILDSTPNKNGIPIAITETNVVINDLCYDDISEEEQARMLTERYYCLANAGAKSVFWWQPADSETCTDTPDDNKRWCCFDGVRKNGLFRTDLSLKPAYYALKEIGAYLNPLLPGDANGDGVVGGTDLELLKGDYLGTPEHNTDFNSDGRVDSEDFAILQANYSQ